MNPDVLSANWQSGDPGAFAALVKQWQQRVARFLVRLVGHGEVVQDLCQEVFLRVYQARMRYREQGTFSTWLFQIALNVARDHGRRPRRPHLTASYEQEDDTPAALALCEQRELVRALDEAVAGLPPPLREVLVLRHYENMRFEDMSRLLAIPASTLKSRFGVALERLRLHLKERGYSHEETH
jgi:RNA polymerase sigma-70 factor (ECF subfamily)